MVIPNRAVVLQSIIDSSSVQISNLLLYRVNPLLFSLRFYRSAALEYDHLDPVFWDISVLSRTFHALVLTEARKQHVKSTSTYGAWNKNWDALFLIFMDSQTDSDRKNWTIVNLRDQKETVTSLWITCYYHNHSV